MSFQLGKSSLRRLQGVHPDLVKVVKAAITITEVDFTVLEGLRSNLRQQALYNAGASQTLTSRHLTGHAVDLGAYVDHQVDWSWPLYHKIHRAMSTASAELNIDLIWGGDWKHFPDGPHYQLPWGRYS